MEQLNITSTVEQVKSLGQKKGNVNIVYEIVNFWIKTSDRSPKTADVQLRLIDPTGNELHRVIQTMDLKDFKRMRTRFKITGFPISGSGIYRFQVAIRQGKDKDFKKVTEVPVEVNISSKEVKLKN